MRSAMRRRCCATRNLHRKISRGQQQPRQPRTSGMELDRCSTSLAANASVVRVFLPARSTHHGSEKEVEQTQVQSRRRQGREARNAQVQARQAQGRTWSPWQGEVARAGDRDWSLGGAREGEEGSAEEE